MQSLLCKHVSIRHFAHQLRLRKRQSAQNAGCSRRGTSTDAVCGFPTKVLLRHWFHLVERPHNFHREQGSKGRSQRAVSPGTKLAHLPGDRVDVSFLCCTNPAVAPRADWCPACRDSGAQNEACGRRSRYDKRDKKPVRRRERRVRASVRPPSIWQQIHYASICAVSAHLLLVCACLRECECARALAPIPTNLFSALRAW